MVSERPLTGKVAWVTGSSRGLGRVIATHLGTLGASVVIHGTTPTSSRAFGEADSLASVAEAVAAESDSEVLMVHGDLTDPAAVDRIVSEIRARFGQIDILVNNAGGDIGVAGTMGPGGGKPSGDVAAAIDRDLGGLEKFQNDFNAAGGRVFGSGWVFVTVGRDGKLALETKPNQDTPIMEGKRVLMGNDVWEHAYYLHYQNRRPDYLKAWWNVVNWNKVAERYAAAKAGTLEV